MTRPRLLYVNGIVLGSISASQFVLDFVGYFAGLGPTGAALEGNLDTIGYAEAHGLALILALAMIHYRHDALWHRLAAAVHLLLGTSNLVFWPVFVASGLVPVGFLATLMHAIFATLQTRAAFSSSHE